MLRQAKSWRQLDLAEQAGISENYVSELELGRKEVCLKTQLALANALGLSLEQLMESLQGWRRSDR